MGSVDTVFIKRLGIYFSLNAIIFWIFFVLWIGLCEVCTYFGLSIRQNVKCTLGLWACIRHNVKSMKHYDIRTIYILLLPIGVIVWNWTWNQQILKLSRTTTSSLSWNQGYSISKSSIFVPMCLVLGAFACHRSWKFDRQTLCGIIMILSTMIRTFVLYVYSRPVALCRYNLPFFKYITSMYRQIFYFFLGVSAYHSRFGFTTSTNVVVIIASFLSLRNFEHLVDYDKDYILLRPSLPNIEHGVGMEILKAIYYSLKNLISIQRLLHLLLLPMIKLLVINMILPWINPSKSPISSVFSMFVSYFNDVYQSLVVSIMVVFVIHILSSTFLIIMTCPIDFAKLSPPKHYKEGHDDLLIDSFEFSSTSQKPSKKISRNYDPTDLQPYWVEVSRVQKEFLQNEILKKEKVFRPSWFGKPCVESFLHKEWSSTRKFLIKFLAMQDFARAIMSCRLRRERLYENRWSDAAIAACAVIDSTTVQLKYTSAYMLEDFKSIADDREKTVMLNARLLRNDVPIPLISREAKELARDIPSDGSYIASREQYSKVKKFLGWVKRNFPTVVYVTLRRALIVCDIYDNIHAPLPPLLVQYAVHALDGLSLGLVHAVREDHSRVARSHVPSVLASCIDLDRAIVQYLDLCGSNLSYYHPQRRSGFSSFGQKQKREVKESEALRGLQATVNQAINRILGAYKDNIYLDRGRLKTLYQFPVEYEVLLKDKLSNMHVGGME